MFLCSDIMTAGKRRSKRTTRKLRTQYPRGVRLHVVESDDGDHSTNPSANNSDCNLATDSTNPTTNNTDHNIAANNTDNVDVVKPSQDKKNYKRVQGNQWTEEEMKGAIQDVEDNSFSIRGVAKKWGIPASSLTYWLSGLTTTKTKGPPTVLSLEEELEVVQWCKDLAQLGCGLEVLQLKSHVAHIFQTRPNQFKNGLLGRSWWVGFRKRHPDLTLRTAESLDRDREMML